MSAMEVDMAGAMAMALAMGVPGPAAATLLAAGADGVLEANAEKADGELSEEATAPE